MRFHARYSSHSSRSTVSEVSLAGSLPLLVGAVNYPYLSPDLYFYADGCSTYVSPAMISASKSMSIPQGASSSPSSPICPVFPLVADIYSNVPLSAVVFFLRIHCSAFFHAVSVNPICACPLMAVYRWAILYFMVSWFSPRPMIPTSSDPATFASRWSPRTFR